MGAKGRDPLDVFMELMGDGLIEIPPADTDRLAAALEALRKASAGPLEPDHQRRECDK